MVLLKEFIWPNLVTQQIVQTQYGVAARGIEHGLTGAAKFFDSLHNFG